MFSEQNTSSNQNETQNSKLETMPAVSEQKEQNQTQPANTENQDFKQKKGVLKKILLIVLGVLVAGGVAFGGWWAYDNYVANSPVKILDQMFEKTLQIKSGAIDSFLNVKVTVMDSLKNSDDMSMLKDLMDESGDLNFKINFSSLIDARNKEKTKSDNNVSINLGQEMGEIDLDFININENLFIKINKMINPVKDLIGDKKITGQWVVIKNINKHIDSVSKLPQKENQRLLNVIKENAKDIFIMKKDHGIEKINNTEVYHYTIAINKDKLILKINSTQTDINSPKAEEYLKEKNLWQWLDSDFDLYINKNNYNLEKIKTSLQINNERNSVLANLDDATNIVLVDEFQKVVLDVDLNLSQHNKDLKIEEPENYIDLEEMIAASFMGVQAKSRDLKRITNIKNIQTALELYKNDKGNYPAAPEGVILSENIENNILKEYMESLPSNPTPGGSDYFYQSEGEGSYELSFSLEEDSGGYRAGKIVLTEEPLPDSSPYKIDESERRKDLTTQSARDAKRVADIKRVQTALELYYNDHAGYPRIPQGIAFNESAENFLKDYMQNLPLNPEPGGMDYIYKSSDESSPNSYELKFELEAETHRYGPGLVVATQAGIFNKEEFNQKNKDTDGDGLKDVDEINVWMTDPNIADTDGDGYEDGNEVEHGYDPLVPGSARLEDR